MKKLLLLIVTGALIFAFSACGDTATTTDSDIAETEAVEETSLPDITADYTMEEQNCYQSAMSYIESNCLSKQGLIDQLSSEYGEGYPKEVAEKVVNDIDEKGLIDWDAECKESAISYVESNCLSKQGLIDQLSSESGENFTKEQSEKAVESIEKEGLVDWDAECKESALAYLESGGFSKNELIDQLSSEYGENFTREQAEKAVEEVYK